MGDLTGPPTGRNPVDAIPAGHGYLGFRDVGAR
jgi:hypothetical protein